MGHYRENMEINVKRLTLIFQSRKPVAIILRGDDVSVAECLIKYWIYMYVNIELILYADP